MYNASFRHTMIPYPDSTFITMSGGEIILSIIDSSLSSEGSLLGNKIQYIPSLRSCRMLNPVNLSLRELKDYISQIFISISSYYNGERLGLDNFTDNCKKIVFPHLIPRRQEFGSISASF